MPGIHAYTHTQTVSSRAEQAMHILIFYTLRCADLRFGLCVGTTCDLSFWFMWFFHSTYVSCQSLLHVCAHHIGKKNKTHTYRFFILTSATVYEAAAV